MTTQATWFCGLYEGEGYLQTSGRSITIWIDSTNLDVLDKARLVFGGSIRPRKHDGNPNHKRSWVLRIGGRERVRGILIEIMSMLGKRRAARAAQVVAMPIARKTRLLESPARKCNDINPIQPSSRGSKRHLRKGERPCSNCMSANRLFQQEMRSRRKQANP